MQNASSTGFRPEILEKVIHLLNLLNAIQGHPFLKDRLALKGGTALNLFLFDLPRLSVDIDLNYVAAEDRQAMLEERPKVEKALQDVCGREGMAINRMPTDHAGGKWRLRYNSALSDGGNLEVDLNFMFRVPLWPITKSDSVRVGNHQAKVFPVLDLHELAAGKLAALFARHASRDLFDAHRLLTQTDLDQAKLRLGFVVYGGMNRKDWRTVHVDDIAYDADELRDQLLPVVRQAALPGDGPHPWAQQLIDECREAVSLVLPLRENERQFLDNLLERGEIHPELLTDDPAMRDRIAKHPAVQWKAVNVRQHHGG
jgi:hypothetical protein